MSSFSVYWYVRFWSRSRFTIRPQCDTVVNNMCESFNSVLLHTRTKPIISMLEDIRVYIMKKWASNRKKIAAYKGSIMPKILDRLKHESKLVRHWLPRYTVTLILFFCPFKLVPCHYKICVFCDCN